MSPPRAGTPLVLAFGLAVATLILLTGPLLLFFPPVVSFEQARHDVPATFGVGQASVDQATGSMLADLLLNGDFQVQLGSFGGILDASERSHMRDVGAVVRGLILADLLALVVALLAGRWLRDERARRGRAMLRAAAGIGAAAVVLGAFFAFAFDAAFTAFHTIFFASGTWQFGPDSNLLRFFPEPLWVELSLIAGATILLGAVVVTLLARRDLR